MTCSFTIKEPSSIFKDFQRPKIRAFSSKEIFKYPWKFLFQWLNQLINFLEGNKAIQDLHAKSLVLKRNGKRLDDAFNLRKEFWRSFGFI